MDTTRYTTILSTENLVLQADCPVHAKKVQCTKDTLTGSLFLQVRYVNRCERIVESLILRVSILEHGSEIASIRSLPVSGLRGKPHQCFGDERTIVLPRCGDAIKVFIEQINFSDGYLWRSKSGDTTLAIEPPVRICGKAQPCRRSGYWYCSCSMVNPDSRATCDYCGSEAPPKPKEVLPVTEPTYSVEQMLALIQAMPSQAPAAAPETIPEPVCEPVPEKVVEEAPAAEPAAGAELPAPEEAPKKKSLKWLWVTLIVLLLLGIGACIYFGFPYPYYKYYQANQLKNEEKYDKAIAAFEGLGDYRDSAEQIESCRYMKAVEAYNAGNYADALEQAGVLGSDDGNALALLCLRDLSYLSLTQDYDYLSANNYMERARGFLRNGEPEPDWFPDVRQQSLYLEAVENYGKGNYAAAVELFTQSGYANSDEYITLCSYQVAKEYYENGEYEQAVEAFRALGNDEAAMAGMDEAMYAYVEQNFDPDNETTGEYLYALIERGYDGAQALYDELYAWTVEFTLISTGTLKDVSELVFSYSVTDGPRDGSPLSITMEYTLPNGEKNTVVLPDAQLFDSFEQVKWTDLLSVKDNTKGTLKLRFLITGTDDVLWTMNAMISE
ncbi:MAG: hypothetical protein MJ085_01735 [Clostridia bacterium]|nr:hypothetical protein [Clostridia bacterium]